jgi:hypothetical protein
MNRTGAWELVLPADLAPGDIVWHARQRQTVSRVWHPENLRAGLIRVEMKSPDGMRLAPCFDAGDLVTKLAAQECPIQHAHASDCAEATASAAQTPHQRGLLGKYVRVAIAIADDPGIVIDRLDGMPRLALPQRFVVTEMTPEQVAAATPPPAPEPVRHYVIQYRLQRYAPDLEGTDRHWHNWTDWKVLPEKADEQTAIEALALEAASANEPGYPLVQHRLVQRTVTEAVVVTPSPAQP